MIEIKRYLKDKQRDWDQLVGLSRQDTFLFSRNFMDYHSDRFEDCSFMIYRKGKLVALLPGNIAGNVYYSHQGLTYGGLISTTKISTIDVLNIFQNLNEELVKLGVSEVIYKPVPPIYHKIPAQEDIYALFKLKSEKIACHISSTIFQNQKVAFIESRKSGIRKALREGVTIIEGSEPDDFWAILESNLLNTYGRPPVHSLDEISKLIELFPENIKVYTCKIGDTAVAGSLLFIMENVVHVQYISASDAGKQTGALDLLFDELINKVYSNKPVFDFGQSTEQMGDYLNENLIFQKEGFGGRGTLYEVYKYKIQ